MPAARTRPVAGALAALSCAAVLSLSACGTGGSGGSGGSGHQGGHPAPHSGSHPEHRTTAPAGPTGEFDPQDCPTGRVC